MAHLAWSTPMSIERRYHERCPAHVRLVVQHQGQPLRRASALDVGPGGLLVEVLGARLRRGMQVEVTLPVRGTPRNLWPCAQALVAHSRAGQSGLWFGEAANTAAPLVRGLLAAANRRSGL